MALSSDREDLDQDEDSQGNMIQFNDTDYVSVHRDGRGVEFEAGEREAMYC